MFLNTDKFNGDIETMGLWERAMNSAPYGYRIEQLIGSRGHYFYRFKLSKKLEELFFI